LSHSTMRYQHRIFEWWQPSTHSFNHSIDMFYPAAWCDSDELLGARPKSPVSYTAEGSLSDTNLNKQDYVLQTVFIRLPAFIYLQFVEN